MSYKTEVQTDASGKWYGNSATYSTPKAAKDAVEGLAGRWTLVHSTRVIGPAGRVVDFAGDPDPDEITIAECSVCGGPRLLLGSLGKLDHFRCRCCGSESSNG